MRYSVSCPKIFLLCTFAFLFALPITAQEIKDEEPVLVDLDVQGDPVLSREEVLALFPTPLGQVLSRAAVRTLLKNLYQTGKIQDASVSFYNDGAGTVLVVRLSARLFVSSVSFEGVDALEIKRVERAFGIEVGDELYVERVSLAQKSLQTALFNAGYRQASVQTFENKEENGIALLVTVDLATPTLISEIRVKGIELLEIPEKQLRLKAGVLLDKTQEKDDARTLRSFIRSFGYYQAKVTGPFEEKASNDGIALVYQVELGPRYEVDIVGLSGISREEALQVLALEEEGSIASSTLRAASSRLRIMLEELGYAKASISAKIVVRQDKYRLVRFEVLQGPLVAIAEIRFSGMTQFSEKVLKKIVFARLEEGLSLPQERADYALDDLGVLSGRKTPYENETNQTQTRPLRPREIYRPKALQRALADITARYDALGYEEMTIDAPRVLENQDGRYQIEVFIKEGPQTLVESILFEGIASFSRRKLLPEEGPFTASPVGSPYTPERLAETKRLIREIYQNQGYLYASIETSVQTRSIPNGKRVRILFAIDEGTQVKVSGIVVQGNVNVQESAIRRYVPVRKGDILTYKALRLAQRRLISLGVFESVSITLKDKDLPEANKEILLSVRERKAGAFELAGGLSTDDGPRGRFLLSHANLFGKTWAFSFRAQVNDSQLNFFGALLSETFLAPDGEPIPAAELEKKLERKAVVSLRPPILGKAFDSIVFAEVSLLHQRLSRKAFGITKNAFGLSLGTTAEPKRGFSFLLQTDIESDNAEAINGEDLATIQSSLSLAEQDILRVFEGRTILVSLRPQLSLDLRDNRFNPSKGFFAQLNLDLAKSLDLPNTELNFVSLLRTEAVVAAYLPYQKLVFEWIGRAGVVFPLSPESQTPPDRLFFLGGNGSVRGFPEEGLLPEDFSRELREALALREEESRGQSQGEFLTPVSVPRSLGGNSFLAFSTGVRFPLGLSIPLEGEIFLDLGNSWSETLSFSPFLLRGALGAGLRFPTPIGPLRVEGALKLDRRAELEEGVGQIHLTLGAF